jgi:NADPH-dependent 2,4-dienoyl-CoA reductase/sulfur reductase-like enzyme
MKRYCIIGASAAGIAAMHKLHQLDPTAHVTCFSAETELPYNKCFLADFVAQARATSWYSHR